MVEWYVTVSRVLREIRRKSVDALTALRAKDDETAEKIQGYLETDYAGLKHTWQRHFPVEELGYLGRHIGFGMEKDFIDILNRDLPPIEQLAEEHLLQTAEPRAPLGFEQLLDPVVADAAYTQFRDGHFREAVLNSITAVFDLMRARTGLTSDGARLVGEVLSIDRPRLILSEVNTESGRNDQAGFLQILQGAYVGVRNPKAHSLQHDLTEFKAAQYLVFVSLLVRRIREAREP